MSDSEGNRTRNETRGLNTSVSTSSVEDLSEYTDADESISAPTEFLAEFLSAVLLKDYETALKYCNLILQYEPNNATALEFYPLIIEKLQNLENTDEDDIDSEESSFSCNDSVSISDSYTGSLSKDVNISGSEEDQSKPCDSEATTASYSSLEEDEQDRDNNVIPIGMKRWGSDEANGNFSPKVSSKNWLAEEIRKRLHISFRGEVANFNLMDDSSRDIYTPEEQNNHPFPACSSDSESPTDPSSQPSVNTVQEQKKF